MTSQVCLPLAIKRAYRDPFFWDVMVNQSVAHAGPFDGGCLIVARAMLAAVGGGELVRLIDLDKSGECNVDHYGVRVNGVIYDFSGVYPSPELWIDAFSRLEHIRYRLGFAVGLGNPGEIPQDPVSEAAITSLLLRLGRTSRVIQRRDSGFSV